MSAIEQTRKLDAQIEYGKVTEIVKRTGFCGCLTLVRIEIAATAEGQETRVLTRLIQGPIDIGDVIKIT